MGEVGDPEVSALHAGGAALRAAPPAPRAATEGVADFCGFRARDKDGSPCGPAMGPQPLPRGIS
eukprot:15171008-Alexandrium_andersonii.AAC.1